MRMSCFLTAWLLLLLQKQQLPCWLKRSQIELTGRHKTAASFSFCWWTQCFKRAESAEQQQNKVGLTNWAPTHLEAGRQILMKIKSQFSTFWCFDVTLKAKNGPAFGYIFVLFAFWLLIPLILGLPAAGLPTADAAFVSTVVKRHCWCEKILPCSGKFPCLSFLVGAKSWRSWRLCFAQKGLRERERWLVEKAMHAAHTHTHFSQCWWLWLWAVGNCLALCNGTIAALCPSVLLCCCCCWCCSGCPLRMPPPNKVEATSHWCFTASRIRVFLNSHAASPSSSPSRWW